MGQRPGIPGPTCLRSSGTPPCALHPTICPASSHLRPLYGCCSLLMAGGAGGLRSHSLLQAAAHDSQLSQATEQAAEKGWQASQAAPQHACKTVASRVVLAPPLPHLPVANQRPKALLVRGTCAISSDPDSCTHAAGICMAIASRNTLLSGISHRSLGGHSHKKKRKQGRHSYPSTHRRLDCAQMPQPVRTSISSWAATLRVWAVAFFLPSSSLGILSLPQ
jgi:hypothetical protein